MSKGLKMAASAVILAAFLLLFAMWMRSYRIADSIMFSGLEFDIGLESRIGRLAPYGYSTYRAQRDVQIYCLSLDGHFRSYRSLPLTVVLHNRYAPFNPNHCIPYWIVVALAGACTVLPWIRWSWRFSVPSLLAATTLVAAICGLAALQRILDAGLTQL